MSSIRPSNNKKIKFRDSHIINSKEYRFSNSIDHNVKIFKEIFHDDETIMFRYFSNQENPQIRCCIIFIAGMVDDDIIHQALAGITGLMIPKLQGPIVVLRLVFLLAATVLGLYGITFGISLVLIHLLSMRSFGVQYMAYTSILNYEELQDVTIRVPWWHMKFRPKSMATYNLRRQRDGGRIIDKK